MNIQNCTRLQVLSVLDQQTGWTHGSNGAPTFGSWPAALSVDHQQMHVTEIHRAYEGGLRLLFASATDSQVLHHLWHNGLGYSRSIMVPDALFDYNSAVTQITFIQNMAANNSAWMQIVTTPAEARSAIDAGKLAVVISLEFDSLRPDRIVDLVRNHQVRHVIPIHLANGPFGGSAVYGDEFNTNTYFLNGYFFSVTFDPNLNFRLTYPPTAIVFQDPGALNQATVDPGPPETSNYQLSSSGMKNAEGLNKDLFFDLMRLGVLLDVAHMGWQSAEGAISLAEEHQYPLMDSHTGLRDEQLSAPSERYLTISHAARLARLGGVIGLGTSNQANSPPFGAPCEKAKDNACLAAANKAYHDCTSQPKQANCKEDFNNRVDACDAEFCPTTNTHVPTWLESYQYALKVMGGRGVALGTDMNGLSPQIPPHTGKVATYPFMVASQFGPPSSVVSSLPKLELGPHSYDFFNDGLATYGMLPDFLESINELPNSAPALTAIYRSAEDTIEMWEKVEAVAKTLPPRPGPDCGPACLCVVNTCNVNLQQCEGRDGADKTTCSAAYSACQQACLQASACPNGQRCCGSVALSGHCTGSCIALGNSCPLQCTGTTRNCSGHCVDTSIDVQNCGTCGTTCPKNSTCVEGSCASPPVCPANTQWCGRDGRCEKTCINR